MDNCKYTIYQANKFSNELLEGVVAVFYDLKLAKEFVDYQLSIGEDFVIVHNDIYIYPDVLEDILK